MKYLGMWWANLLSYQSSGPIERRVEAWGEAQSAGGPPARVRIAVEPALLLDVADDLDADLRARLEASGGYDPIVFGVIDVMLCAPTVPVNAFKLSILAVEGAEPGASGEVLRLAARDAARSVLSRAGQGD